jgi:hypothetical protein
MQVIENLCSMTNSYYGEFPHCIILYLLCLVFYYIFTADHDNLCLTASKSLNAAMYCNTILSSVKLSAHASCLQLELHGLNQAYITFTHVIVGELCSVFAQYNSGCKQVGCDSFGKNCAM